MYLDKQDNLLAKLKEKTAQAKSLGYETKVINGHVCIKIMNMESRFEWVIFTDQMMESL